MLEYLLKKFKGYNSTCSISNPLHKSVAFVVNKKYANQLLDIPNYYSLHVLAPKDTDLSDILPKINKNIHITFVDDPNYAFTIYHNYIYRDYIPKKPIIGKRCKIHPTVLMDIDGFKVANAPDGSKIQFIHTGNIVIEDDVEVGPYTIIHRGTLDSTIIKKGVKIGAKNNIAHNNIIGENTVFAAGAIINGSVTIGKNCWIGSGALIKNGVSICDNVVVGLGAVVVKDIIEPGIYVGTPAKFLKSLDSGWNF